MTPIGKRLTGVAGAAIGLVGLGFVIRLVLRERETISALAADGNPGWFAVAWVVGLVGMTSIGLTWGVIVRDLDRPLPLPETLRSYFVGQLGKYVPGGIWAVMGRGAWAQRAGVARGAAYLSTVLSISTAYLAAAGVVAVSLALGARPNGSILLAAGVAALAPLGVLAMHPVVFDRVLGLLGRLRKRETVVQPPPTWGHSVGYVLRQLPSWLLISLATWCVARGLGVQIDGLALVLATCTSWVAGFLFLPTPGGIGVREAVFVAVLGSDGLVAAVALAARLLFVVVDAAGAGVSSYLVTRGSRETTT